MISNAASDFTEEQFTAGHVRRRIRMPHSDKTLRLSFWYPSHSPESCRHEGVYALSAAFGAAPAPGCYPVIGISHGSGGNDRNHHDWAESLARAGYVVAAPTHVGDSRERLRGVGTLDDLLERPRQLAFAMRAACADPLVGQAADSARMAVMGFSAGGFTALALLGGVPAFDSRFAVRSACFADDEALEYRARWRSVGMPELRAGVLFAPYASVFSRDGLAGVRAPMRIFRAASDTVTENAVHADALAARLPTVPEVETVSGGHYVFMAPAVDAMATRYPKYYRDAAGIDRAEIHAIIAKRIAAFFTKTLRGSICLQNSAR